MPQQRVNIGPAANSATGDSPRVAFSKLNANDADLDARVTNTAINKLNVDGDGSKLTGVVNSFLRPDGTRVSKSQLSLDDIQALATNGNASAAVAAPAVANARLRALSDRYRDRLSILDFNGVQVDGAASSSTAFSRACSDINTNGRDIALPPMTFVVDPGAIQIGTGSATQGSNLHGGGFRGTSAPLNAPGQGTTIRAASPGGALATISGITSGVVWKGILLDCAGKASIALDAYSVCGSEIEVIARQFTGYGFALRCRAPAGSAGWCSSNRIALTSIVSDVVGAYGAGVLLDGDPANNYDPHNNLFTTGTVQIANRADAPVYGAQLRFCDSNTFIETDFSVYGAGNAGSAAVLFDGGSRSAYPQNNLFYGCSIPSASVTANSGTNQLLFHTTQDGEAIPNNPKLIGFTDMGQYFGGWKLPISLSDLAVRKDLPAVNLYGADGTVLSRVYQNAGGGSNFGFGVDQYVGGVARTDFLLAADGTPYFRLNGGLVPVQFGAADSAGSGFRTLRIAN